MTGRGNFTPELFRFLRELRRQNNREWFQRNKNRYETDVRDPFLRFIADFGPRLKTLSPHFVADPSPVGGSMMRIYRDIRFSKDKTPYKTAVAAHFWHAMGKEGATPAFYLHLEPDHSSVGAGIWRPEPQSLKRIRDAIAQNPKKWERATSGREFRLSCGVAGESLKRPPRGYDADHPYIDDIKRKDFATSSPLREAQVCSAGFTDTLIDTLRLVAPFMKFLSEAVVLPF